MRVPCRAFAVVVRLRLFLAALLTLLAVTGPVPTALAQTVVSRETLRDYDVVNGHFFTQTGGSRNSDLGYAITDEGDIRLWTEFQRLGGVAALGYPISQRFVWDGFVVQAMQKAVLQWRPEQGRAVYVNVLDELTRSGLDDWLLVERMLPRPASFPEEATLSFDQIIQNRLRLLDGFPALRTAYFAAPNPVETNGLPVAPVADMGPAYVLRAQRRAFQLWKVAMPFARAGEVTVVNAGDLAKEAALYPASAVQPVAAWTQIATPPGSAVRLSLPEVEALRAVVERARPAIVRLSDGGTGLGSGILIDPSGLILTNSHVVDALNASRMRATLPDGRSFPARALGSDDWTDVALVKIDGTDLPHVSLGSAQSLTIGQRVIGIGYAPIFPGAPSAKTGTVRSLAGQIQTQGSYPLFDLITSDTYLHPGDSGGALLDLSGRVVGVNSAIGISRRGQTLTGYSIPIEGAQQIVLQILTGGGVPRPHMGVSVQDVTPDLAASLGLPVTRGVLIRQVQPDSPAAIAGIVAGDVIVGIGDQPVRSLDDLRRAMIGYRVGDTIRVSVASVGRPTRTVAITLAERPPRA